MSGSGLQGILAAIYLCKGEGTLFRKAEGNIQIPKSHIAIDTKYRFTKMGKGGGKAGSKGGFARSAFAGQNSDQFAHSHTSSQ
jgi:hypothetical protein